jgi:sensor histidine kinase YesM
MSSIAKQKIRKQVFNLFRQDFIYHVLFWLALIIVFLLINDQTLGFFYTLGMEFINVGFYAVIVYFNLYYLIPKYLKGKTFLFYGVLLLLSSLLITPIKILFFSILFFAEPLIKNSFIQNQQFIFLSTFFFGGSSTVFKIINDWMKHQREKKELQQETLQSELKYLKTQINPHFLFNTLNNLYALTLKKDDRAPEIVMKLSEMMRYMLYDCNERRVMLSKEVHYITNYLELEKLRQGKKCEVNFEVEGEITDQRIAPLMFIPFLENSFKHGLNTLITEGYVHIKLKVKEDHIKLKIENSKAPTLPAQNHNKKSGGIGLKNIKRRLNLMYPSNYYLDIKDNPDHYKVNLSINLA